MKYTVTLQQSAICEFIVSLWAFGEKKTHPTLDLGTGWIKRLKKELPPDFPTELRALDKTTRTLLMPLVLSSPTQTPSDFIAWLEALDWSQIYQTGLEFTDKIPSLPPPVIEDWKTRFCRLLRVWYEVYFSRVEQSIMPNLAKDLSRQPQAADPAELVQQLSNGIRLDNLPKIKHVRLIPQYHFRPWNIKEIGRTELILLYPCRTEPSSGEIPPALLRLTKALADENRLRILRLLAQSPHTFTEIVQKVGITKSTVHHHLLSLRAAGLVWIYLSSGRNDRVSLRREAVDGIQGQLLQYLTEEPK